MQHFWNILYVNIILPYGESTVPLKNNSTESASLTIHNETFTLQLLDYRLKCNRA